MKPKYILALSVLIALLFFLQPAFAINTGSCKVSDIDKLMKVDKTAPGTKVNVTLTMYFEKIPQLVDLGCVDGCLQGCVDTQFCSDGNDESPGCIGCKTECLEDNENCENCYMDQNTDMYFYVRATIGNDNLTALGSNDNIVINKSDSFYPFAGLERNICYNDVDSQQQAIITFAREVVVPEMFAGQTFEADDIQIKDIRAFVQDDTELFPGCCVDDYGVDIDFIVMDVLLAVH